VDGTAPQGAGTAIRVLLVDDHEVVREGLKAILATAPDIQVVGEAASYAEAVALAARLAPDVAVVDVRLPDGSGVDACREIRSDRPATRVIVLTSYADRDALFAAIMAGASGYLLKQTRGRDLLEAIRTVHAGHSLLDPAVTGEVLERLRDPGAAGAAHLAQDLTPLERRILALVADGKTNREIAKEVFLSDTTVKHYVSGILRKLQANRRSEAAAIWVRTQGGSSGPGV
jgi:two-component system response regulator DevR